MRRYPGRGGAPPGVAAQVRRRPFILAGALALSASALATPAIVYSPVMVQPGPVVTSPAPAGTITQWKAAPLATGGFAFPKNQGPCCTGTVVHLDNYFPASGMWAASFYSDTSGNFPVNDAYEVTLVRYFDTASLQGLAPA